MYNIPNALWYVCFYRTISNHIQYESLNFKAMLPKYTFGLLFRINRQRSLLWTWFLYLHNERVWVCECAYKDEEVSGAFVKGFWRSVTCALSISEQGKWRTETRGGLYSVNDGGLLGAVVLRRIRVDSIEGARKVREEEETLRKFWSRLSNASKRKNEAPPIR